MPLETDHPKLRREIWTKTRKVLFTVILVVFKEKADHSLSRLYPLRTISEALSCEKA